MAVIKFLFVLALAVPLAVFMWNYINKLSDEFQQSVARGKGSSAEQGNPQPAPKKKGRKPADVGRKKAAAGPLVKHKELPAGRREGSTVRRQDIHQVMSRGRCRSIISSFVLISKIPE